MSFSPEQIKDLLYIILLLFVIFTLYLAYQSRIILKKIEASRYIKRLEKESDIFNEDNLYRTIYETFDTLQKAAVEKRLDIAKEYMSEEGYEAWSIPLNWAIYNNEPIRLHDTKISYCWIVAIHADLKKEDYFWVYLQGYHDHQPLIFTQEEEYQLDTVPSTHYAPHSGSRMVTRVKNNEFQEFWKFIRIEDQFYLDTIAYRKDIKIRNLKSSINL